MRIQDASERRQHTRFELMPMYSRIVVQTLDANEHLLDGHAYDLSEGGVRFELDEPLPCGSRVAMRIDLPHCTNERSTERRSIFVFANIVWVDDEEPFGPVKMAAVFTQFARKSDAEMLRRRLFSGRYAMAA